MRFKSFQTGSKMESVWPLRTDMQRPKARSHTLSVLSTEPDTAREPSLLIATLVTAAVCPMSTQRHLRVNKSQTRKVRS